MDLACKAASGVSAVVHDIVTSNQDLMFGISHLTWDTAALHEDLYGMPWNVAWVRPVCLSMQEHKLDFLLLRRRALRMRAAERTRLAERVFDALGASLVGDVDPLWQL